MKFLPGLKDAISLIPDNFGHADLLPVFCSSILNVRNAFGPASEPWILNALASKLKGSAATGFAARLTQYTTIGPLLQDLKQQYWGREGVDSLKRKLQTITQEPTENAASFGLRVQAIHNSLINALDQDPNIIDSHREILKQIAVKDACEQFLCGLRPELESATRAKRPVLLSEAIDAAISHESCRGMRDSKTSPENVNIQYISTEKSQNNRTSGNRAPKSCDFCKRIGHEILECRTLARSINKDRSTDLNSIATRKHCIFCKRNGHDYTECRQLHRRLLDGSISASDSQVFFSSHHNTDDLNENRNAPIQRSVRFADNQSSYNNVPRNPNYNDSYTFNRNNNPNRTREYTARGERRNYTPYNRYNYQNPKNRFTKNNSSIYEKGHNANQINFIQPSEQPNQNDVPLNSEAARC